MTQEDIKKFYLEVLRPSDERADFDCTGSPKLRLQQQPSLNVNEGKD